MNESGLLVQLSKIYYLKQNHKNVDKVNLIKIVETLVNDD